MLAITRIDSNLVGVRLHLRPPRRLTLRQLPDASNCGTTFSNPTPVGAGLPPRAKRQSLNLQFFGRAAVEFDGAHDQPKTIEYMDAKSTSADHTAAGPVVVANQPEGLRLWHTRFAPRSANGIATDFVRTTGARA